MGQSEITFAKFKIKRRQKVSYLGEKCILKHTPPFKNKDTFVNKIIVMEHSFSYLIVNSITLQF